MKETKRFLSREEQDAMDQLLNVMKWIQSWRLKANGDVLVMHVHGLQQFIVQHALQREYPNEFSAWFKNA